MYEIRVSVSGFGGDWLDVTDRLRGVRRVEDWHFAWSEREGTYLPGRITADLTCVYQLREDHEAVDWIRVQQEGVPERRYRVTTSVIERFREPPRGWVEYLKVEASEVAEGNGWIGEEHPHGA